jgi:phosphoribosyl-AMP cyclohydrolase
MDLSFTDPQMLSHNALEAGDVFAPRFDDKGLITAVAVEAGSGVVLMVAYMNEEALRLTLESGEAHYFSRSRGHLWKKGETSGEVQKVIEVRADCDQDTLVVVVEQTGRGAACHTGRKTCFYRRVVIEDGEVRLADTGEPKLFDPDLVYNR